MVAKPTAQGSQTVVSVNRDTYRRMTTAREAAGKPTAALKEVFAQGMSLIKK